MTSATGPPPGNGRPADGRFHKPCPVYGHEPRITEVLTLSQYASEWYAPIPKECAMPKTKRSLPRSGVTPLLVALDRRTRVPLQRQIYFAIRRSILGGQLRPGTRLPPSRALAADLAVSRT